MIAHLMSRQKEKSSEIPPHGNVSKCKTFTPASQIVLNKHNDEELELYTKF